MTTHRALCKYRGMLVIASFTKCSEGQHNRCPECGDNMFNDINGWIECDCGFAILKTDYDRIVNEKVND